MIKAFFFFLFSLSVTLLQAQVISGHLVNANSEPVENVHIHVLQYGTSTISNEDGKFSLWIDGAQSPLSISFSHVSYRDTTITIEWPTDSLNMGTIFLQQKIMNLDEVLISTLRIDQYSPFTHQNLDKEDIEKNNIGQDLPTLLQFLPSTTITSDAGNGIGYTGIRIRGSDPSRINVTLNGIPYNDAESQQVFLVDLPDMASSISDIQVQRGVASSTNGSGAFGASIHLNLFDDEEGTYAQFNNSLGSFGTRRHTLKLHSGLVKKHWNFNLRLSNIASDGYINRASADLKSLLFLTSFTNQNTKLDLMLSRGKERTYQSWYGTPESRAKGDVEGMNAYCSRNGLSDTECKRLMDEGRSYNFYTYDNQVDDYTQDHLQLHWRQIFNDEFSGGLALHYTHGKGFFEQFRPQDDFADYDLTNPVINGEERTSSDFIRRRWLDNDFYGFTYNLSYYLDDFNVKFGGGYHNYLGDHLGEIIDDGLTIPQYEGTEYYRNRGEKSEFSSFVKTSLDLLPKLKWIGELQFRKVDYTIAGIDADLQVLDEDASFEFFNPKIGMSYFLSPTRFLSLSYARANREPDRNDFVDNPSDNPVIHESLHDIEFSFRKKDGLNIEVVAYYMNYQNQLVLSGALNDVGSSLRVNVPKSYRLGLEMIVGYQVLPNFNWQMNTTLSRNKINTFTEILYVYTNGYDVVENKYENTDISFSPNLIASNIFTWQYNPRLSMSLLTKYVGSQFLDNTSDDDRSLDAYMTNDMRVNYNLPFKGLKQATLIFQLSNILNEMYSSNGYTYSYIYESLITENFHYPQAGRNFMLALNLTF